MQNNSGDFSMQDALRLAKSPAGQQLIELLKNADATTVQRAMDHANAGNYSQAKQSLSALLQSEEAKNLLRQLGGQADG